MKGEALRSASLDHSLSPVLWGPLSSCMLQSCRVHKANSHTREETCRSDAEMWGKITFPGRKECKSAFWREVTGQFGTGRTYIYYPCVCLCVLRWKANKWEVSLKMEHVNENTRLGSACARAAEELLCEVYARECTLTHTHAHECSVWTPHLLLPSFKFRNKNCSQSVKEENGMAGDSCNRQTLITGGIGELLKYWKREWGQDRNKRKKTRRGNGG